MTKSLLLIRYDYLLKGTSEWLVVSETRIEAPTQKIEYSNRPLAFLL